MNAFLLILAQSGRTDNLRQAFRNEDGYAADISGLVRFIAALLALLVALLILTRWHQRRSAQQNKDCPFKLLRHTLRCLKIGLIDRWIVRRLARSADLPQPAVLLISPGLWDKYSASWTGDLYLAPFRSHARNRLERLKPLLFEQA
jgi:hypothetical protein